MMVRGGGGVSHERGTPVERSAMRLSLEREPHSARRLMASGFATKGGKGEGGEGGGGRARGVSSSPAF